MEVAPMDNAILKWEWARNKSQ